MLLLFLFGSQPSDASRATADASAHVHTADDRATADHLGRPADDIHAGGGDARRGTDNDALDQVGGGLLAMFLLGSDLVAAGRGQRAGRARRADWRMAEGLAETGTMTAVLLGALAGGCADGERPLSSACMTVARRTGEALSSGTTTLCCCGEPTVVLAWPLAPPTHSDLTCSNF